MSKIISLLERLGENAEFRYANAEQLAALMVDTDPTLVDAVIAGDQQRLETILGARTNVICGVHPAEEPDEDESDEEPGNEPNQSNVA